MSSTTQMNQRSLTRAATKKKSHVGSGSFGEILASLRRIEERQDGMMAQIKELANNVSVLVTVVNVMKTSR